MGGALPRTCAVPSSSSAPPWKEEGRSGQPRALALADFALW